MDAWSGLSLAQQTELLSAPDCETAAGCELLGFDLSLVADITDDLDVTGGTADIVWTGAATVHRRCDIVLSRELDWGNDLVRLYRTYSSETAGLSCRADRGVFVLTAPDLALAEDPQSFQVAGQDRLYLLNRQVGQSYTVAAGTNVLTALRTVFSDAGLTGVLVDSSRADATVPSDMAWPLIPASDTSSASQPAGPADSGVGSDGSGPTTWLQIVNALLGLISYRGCWADESGYFRCGPYADPASRPPSFAFDADTLTSTIAVDRTISGNYWAADSPNLYVFLWSNMPDSGSTPATPTEGDGIYTVTVTDGRAAANRNGLVWPTQISYTAASHADLVAQGDARVAADGRLTTSVKASTVPFPASHYDVLTVNDSALGGSKVEATSWTEHLDGSDTDWEWTLIS